MLELAAVVARLGLCSVLLCWMQFMALGLERLQSPSSTILSGTLGSLEMRSVLLCWMQLTALGMPRLQSSPFDHYATIRQYLSSPSSLWLYWNSLLVTVEDRRPLV